MRIEAVHRLVGLDGPVVELHQAQRVVREVAGPVDVDFQAVVERRDLSARCTRTFTHPDVADAAARRRCARWPSSIFARRRPRKNTVELALIVAVTSTIVEAVTAAPRARRRAVARSSRYVRSQWRIGHACQSSRSALALTRDPHERVRPPPAAFAHHVAHGRASAWRPPRSPAAAAGRSRRRDSAAAPPAS